jgi:hypothetical protein
LMTTALPSAFEFNATYNKLRFLDLRRSSTR